MKILLIALLLNIPSAILCGCLMPKGVKVEPEKHIIFEQGLCFNHNGEKVISYDCE